MPNAGLSPEPLHASAPALNVADRLHQAAAARPEALAVVDAGRRSRNDRRERRAVTKSAYATTTFAELDADATRIACGLAEWGVPPGSRLALLVRPGSEFVTLVFALLRAGMVAVLVDPGMGRRNLIRCLAEAEPDGFVAIPMAQALRALLRHRFPRAKWNVTVGRRWGWGGVTLERLRQLGQDMETRRQVADPPWRGDKESEEQNDEYRMTNDELGNACHSSFVIRHSKLSPRLPVSPPWRICDLSPCLASSPAAVIFTSGSTGPAKGVLYTHRMFDTQVREIQSTYSIQPGGVDLACFPLFALFNAAMGVTTVLPDIDFSRPAAADPRKLLAAANDWQVTQAFASPAVWRKLSAHCERTGERIESLRQVYSCGAPVPAAVLRSTLDYVAPNAQMHTPYGATECLPVATIEAGEILNETAAKTDQGAGICVGRRFDTIDWRVIRITDEPIRSLDEAEELPPDEIGELIVRGPQASPCYVTRTECNAESKIGDEANGSDKATGRQVADPPGRGDKESEEQNDEYRMTNDEQGNACHSSFVIRHSKLSPRLPVSLSPGLPATWHRMGDVGYLDDRGRFWYCGRKSQRVETSDGPLFTECVEAVFNALPAVRRSALVGIGARGRQMPVIVIERKDECQSENSDRKLLLRAANHPAARCIRHLLFHHTLPVDPRHNAKINREELADWAAERVQDGRESQE